MPLAFQLSKGLASSNALVIVWDSYSCFLRSHAFLFLELCL